MKNKLRAHIKELADQLIAENTHFDVAQLKQTTGKLYEKLAILEYLESQIEGAEGNFPESLDSKSFREENWFKEPEPLPQPDNKDELIEPLMEKIKDIVAQMPEEADRIDDMLDDIIPKNSNEKENTLQYTKNDLEEFAKSYQQTPTFERKITVPKAVAEMKVNSQIIEPKPKTSLVEHRAKSLNDTAKTGLHIGLNDRLAFIKHLFSDSAEDYARVLSQINSMSSFEEAQRFIIGKVKPDYNYWLQKDMYAERFMALIEKSFS